MPIDFSVLQKIKFLSQKLWQKITHKHTLYKYKNHVLWLILVFFVYGSVYVPPMWWAGFGFVTWIIPAIIFLNFYYFCFYGYLFLKNKTKKYQTNTDFFYKNTKPKVNYLLFFYFWLCLVAVPFWDATLGGWRGWREDFFLKKTTKIPKKSLKNTTFEAISYNVQVFNAYEHLRKYNPKASSQMLNWLAEHPAEIKCLQEFYHLEGSKEFHTIDKLTKTQRPNYQYFVRSERELREKNGFFGTIILTKFPIIKGGNVFEGRLPHQTPIFADVILPNKQVIRVINAHLQSMSIDEKDNQNTIFQKIWNNFSPRTNQIHLLTDFIQKSPYPVLLCTDLNDLPYSYAYYHLKNHLQNAFEIRGNGIGATHNGRIPIIRIDHHFFDSKNIECQNFSVVDTLDVSDHFPVWAKYEIIRN